MAKPLGEDIRGRKKQTACEMLAQKSFAEISLADIARRAKISKGTLYYHYNSKYDILTEIASDYLDRLARELLAWVDNPEKETSTERLCGFVLQRGVNDEHGNLRVYLVSEAVSGNSEIAASLRAQYAKFRDILSARIAARGGTQPEYAAWLVLTLCDGLMIQCLLNNSDIDIPAFIGRTAELLAAI